MAAIPSALRANQPPAGMRGELAPVIPLHPSPSEEGFFESGQDFVLAHGTVEVPHAPRPVAYSVSVPRTLDRPVMHVIVPGFGGFKRSSRGLRDHLATQEHVAAVSFEPARDGGRVRDLLDAQKVHIDTVAAVLQDLPDNEQLTAGPHGGDLDFDRAVLLPQSMGGLAATEHARTHPEETQSVIYLGAVGLEARVMLGYAGRLSRSGSPALAASFLRGQLIPGAGRLGLTRQAANYWLRNPARTLGEIASCFTADIGLSVQELGALGVMTGAIYFSEDKLVPPDAETVAATRQLVDICEVMEGVGHLAPQRRPAEVAAAVGSLARRLSDRSPESKPGGRRRKLLPQT